MKVLWNISKKLHLISFVSVFGCLIKHPKVVLFLQINIHISKEAYDSFAEIVKRVEYDLFTSKRCVW